MEDLILKKSTSLPEISFNAKIGILNISGRSVSENPVPFYQTILEWLNDYYQAPQSKTVLSFSMEYVNSSSAKMLYNIIEKINFYFTQGYQCEVLWQFEEDDESMEELGLHYQSSFNMPFSIIRTS